MLSVASGTQTLNFVITGEVRAGTGVLQGAVNGLTRAVCHADLLHPDDGVRRECHEAYFGPSQNPDAAPEWYAPWFVSPYQYLRRQVFDNPCRGEAAVGVRVLYAEVRRLELPELFDELCRAGDFCLVHVLRNPVCCFVSLRQAERTGRWRRRPGDEPGVPPPPVRVDPAELTAFVRDSLATRERVRRSSDDRLEVHYHDLVADPRGTVGRVSRFLDLPGLLTPPASARLRNRPWAERIHNFDELRRRLPGDVRAQLAEDLV